MFRTTDGGDNWTAINGGLTSLEVYAIAVDPTSAGTVYAATVGDGIFKSTTGGAAWSTVNTGLTSLYVVSLAIDAANPGTVYAGTGNGVFKTTNGGANWASSSSGIGFATMRALAIDPTSPSTVYAGGIGVVYKTTNGGTSWSLVHIGLESVEHTVTPGINELVVDPSSPSTVYVTADTGGVLKTTRERGGELDAGERGALRHPDLDDRPRPDEPEHALRRRSVRRGLRGRRSDAWWLYIYFVSSCSTSAAQRWRESRCAAASPSRARGSCRRSTSSRSPSTARTA